VDGQPDGRPANQAWDESGAGMAQPNFTGIKVFSTTLARDREQMGETITKWLKDNPNAEIVDKTVTQSSDKEFHCLTITLFYRPK